MVVDLRKAYRTILGDDFPPTMEIIIGDALLRYEKVGWEIDGEVKGLRYGENPGQQAALYRLVNGNLTLGKVRTIEPGKWLASDVELLQSGKHPGKTNITDADNALNILRYFMDEPVVAIMKHNNPCGVAIGTSMLDAYQKANMADRVAAFGGAIALNRVVDLETAMAIAENYAEVVVAPEFEDGVMDVFAAKKNLRVMRIGDMSRLKEWVGDIVIDFKSLMDGGIIVQTSYVPEARTLDDIKKLSLGYSEKGGVHYKVQRAPTEQEYRDMWFGWLVESGITSNSVIYVKNGVTVGIGTGEQDRVGVAEIARDKARTKLMDRLCFEKYGIAYNELLFKIRNCGLAELAELHAHRNEIEDEATVRKDGLDDAIMVSDAFFPKRDGIDVGLEMGVRAVIQPGGSESDYEVIQACNERGATMIFTGQRSFRH